jgi:hypothetical protein
MQEFFSIAAGVVLIAGAFLFIRSLTAVSRASTDARMPTRSTGGDGTGASSGGVAPSGTGSVDGGGGADGGGH